MQAPKFKVGEVAIYAPDFVPYQKYAGEYEITAVLSKEQKEIMYPFLTSIADLWYYQLEGLQLKILTVAGDPTTTVSSHVRESSLKKKHLPGEMSYDTLMSSLKLGQPVRV